MHAPTRLTYSTVPLRGAYVAFGAFVFLIALVPTTIVGVQWLDYSAHGGPEPHTAAGSIIPGGLLALWGLWRCLRRDLVTVDPGARTLTWTVGVRGVVLKRESWTFDEVETIGIAKNDAIKNSGYGAFVSGPRGTRALLDYLHTWRLPPRELTETSRLLDKPIKVPERDHLARRH